VLAFATLYQFCMTSLVNMSFDLGHWVKPRSTIWFFKVFTNKVHVDERWVQNFRMSKKTFFKITN
jgi:hypothetical protein